MAGHFARTIRAFLRPSVRLVADTAHIPCRHELRACYFGSSLFGDQSAVHESGSPVSLDQLKPIGAAYWDVPVDQPEQKNKIDEVAKERGSRDRDASNVRHMHEDEKIRHVLDGSGYFDLREHNGPDEEWIGVRVTLGESLVVPAGIHHRFTLHEGNRTKAMRLLKEEPKSTPHNRSRETDQNPFRVGYLESLKGGAISVAISVSMRKKW